MKNVPIMLLGFGNVGQSIARLVEQNDGYAREGVRLTIHSIFDRSGGVATEGHELGALVDAKRKQGRVRAIEGARELALDSALDALSGGVLVDTSITDAQTVSRGSPLPAGRSSAASQLFSRAKGRSSRATANYLLSRKRTVRGLGPRPRSGCRFRVWKSAFWGCAGRS